MMISRLFMVLLLSLPLVACGITAPSGNDGFADLDSLGFRDVDQTMTLSFGPRVLKFAAAHIEDDPEAEALMRNLDGVRVKTYDVVGDEERVMHRIDTMSQKLQEQGWVQVISVREQQERTVMLMKVRRDSIQGLTVITCDDREAVIVNVMGKLRPEMFSETMLALDIDVPQVAIGQDEV